MEDNRAIKIPVKYVTNEGETLTTQVWELADKYALGYQDASGVDHVINVLPVVNWIEIVVGEEWAHDWKEAHPNG